MQVWLSNLHLRSCIERTSDNERFGNAIDRIRKSSRVMPVLEPNRTWSDGACTDANCEDEEDDECQDFDADKSQHTS